MHRRSSMRDSGNGVPTRPRRWTARRSGCRLRPSCPSSFDRIEIIISKNSEIIAISRNVLTFVRTVAMPRDCSHCRAPNATLAPLRATPGPACAARAVGAQSTATAALDPIGAPATRGCGRGLAPQGDPPLSAEPRACVEHVAVRVRDNHRHVRSFRDAPGMACMPIRIDDTLRVRFRVGSMRVSKSRPDRGIVVLPCELLHQRGEVWKGEHRPMVPPARDARRPREEAQWLRRPGRWTARA